ncbi:MAG TPA: phage tail sheath subtilisin-like domain-containing protein [Polyangiaceae bacterium]|nr:phage tail sheath subtilisin-like domain-containing protein [Polyangiaceae bacterium]
MVAVSYPGVYVEEVPSAVRTITGVATSITAFVGRALRGPVNEPQRITSFADYVRVFGDLWRDSTLSYAVQQYFLNGGRDALIVRLINGGSTAKLSGASAGAEAWAFRATQGGKSGDQLAITISHDPDDLAKFTITVWMADSDGTWVVNDEVDSDLTATEGPLWRFPHEELGTNKRVQLDMDELPWVRPAQVIDPQPLKGGADVAAAEADLGGVLLRAATAGVGGDQLRASVSGPTDADAGHYKLLIELLDTDGDLLASVSFDNVTPDAPWPPSPTRVGTTDDLIDLSQSAPPGRPANAERVPFIDGADVEKASTEIPFVASGLPLEAASEGEWGNNLEARFDHDTGDPSDNQLFNLTVREVISGEEVARETFRNLSVNRNHARYIQKVLEQDSKLVRLNAEGENDWSRPDETLTSTGRPDWIGFGQGKNGSDLTAAQYTATSAPKTGIFALEKADLFNLLVIPPLTFESDTPHAVWTTAMGYCKQRRAFLLVDPPTSWNDVDAVTNDEKGLQEDPTAMGFMAGLQSVNATNAALYWPPIKVADPLREFRLAAFPASGAVAGVIARTDAQFGVWKAPAGMEASVTGAQGLAVSLTDPEHGQINPLGINALRVFPGTGTVVWGARTARGSDKLASEWKYVPVRRLALFLEESLYRGVQWAVFEPNDEPLWAQLRLNVGAFMQNLFRQGAFQGRSAREAYLVKCDAETTTQGDIDRGIVNVIVGFAPLKPAEFVVLKISQLAGQV